jgi:hypothetical protein
VNFGEFTLTRLDDGVCTALEIFGFGVIFLEGDSLEGSSAADCVATVEVPYWTILETIEQ